MFWFGSIDDWHRSSQIFVVFIANGLPPRRADLSVIPIRVGIFSVTW